MAEQTTKTIKTKILLRYDVLKNWTEANPELKKGEVAIVAIPTENKELNVNGTTPPQILFKVGDGTSKFNDLPYASGKAADVYSWAKEAKLSIAKDGTGNVVSGIEWDAAANDGKGGIKFTTASVATSEELKGVQDRLTVIEGTGAKSRITLLEEGLAKTDKLIADSKEAWAANTTYSFEQNGKSFTVTPSVGDAQTFTFDYLTANEIATKIELYGYQNAEAVKAIVESYKYTTIESLNNYYTKEDIDNKGFLTEHQSLDNYYNKTEVDGLVSPKADKSYVDEELDKKVDSTTYSGKISSIEGRLDIVEGDNGIAGIKESIGDIELDIKELDEKFGDYYTATQVDGFLGGKADKTELASYETVANADLVRGRVSTLEGHFAEGGRVTEAESKISTLVDKVSNLSGAFQFQGTKETVEALPEASPANKGHVYLVGDLEYASNGTSWIQLGQNGDFVLDSIYQAHLTAQAATDKGQSDAIKAIEDDIKANRENWAAKTSVTDPTAGDGKITVNDVEMVVYALPEDVVQDPNYKHITVTETSVSDGTTTFKKYDDTALAGRVTTVEGKVKALEEKPFDTYATKAEVDVERKRIDTIVNTTIPGINETISTLATKSELSGVEGKVDGVIADYLKGADKTELEGKINNKQDIIADLETIRSGAALGATAVQPKAIEDMLTKTEAASTYETIDNVKAVSDRVTAVENEFKTVTAEDGTETKGRVVALEDKFADWAIIWDCGGASNN